MVIILISRGWYTETANLQVFFWCIKIISGRSNPSCDVTLSETKGACIFLCVHASLSFFAKVRAIIKLGSMKTVGHGQKKGKINFGKSW